MNNKMVHMAHSHITCGDITAMIIIIGVFIASSYFLSQHKMFLQEMVTSNNLWVGMFAYVVAVALFGVVLAPASILPFLPIAVILWGTWVTSILTLLGWTIGAVIAFVLARKYGHPFLKKMINMKRIEHFSKIITGGHPFWALVIFRIFLPVDILSYAAGLFTNIPLRSYILATFIGLVPSTILLVRLASFSIMHLVLAVIVLLCLAFVLNATVVKKWRIAE